MNRKYKCITTIHADYMCEVISVGEEVEVLKIMPSSPRSDKNSYVDIKVTTNTYTWSLPIDAFTLGFEQMPYYEESEL